MKPSNATVTIDGNKFNAIATHVEVSTVHDNTGMPMMGSCKCVITATVDMHDNENMPFSTLSTLFDLAKLVTRDKVKDIKIEFWTDESQQDALCTYTFHGWLSSFSTSSGDRANHTLNLDMQPALDPQQFIDLKMGN